MKIIYLLKIDSQANEYRFHRLALPPDGRVVHRLWGRMHEYLTERWEEFATPEAASKHFNKVVREKEREGSDILPAINDGGSCFDQQTY